MRLAIAKWRTAALEWGAGNHQHGGGRDPQNFERGRSAGVRSQMIFDRSKEPRSIGQALSYEQKNRLVDVADSNPEWQNARLAMTLALCTTMRGVEIRNLRWQDVDFIRKGLTVRRSKTDAGLRSIPMNDDAHAADSGALGAFQSIRWHRSPAFCLSGL